MRLLLPVPEDVYQLAKASDFFINNKKRPSDLAKTAVSGSMLSASRLVLQVRQVGFACLQNS